VQKPIGRATGVCFVVSWTGKALLNTLRTGDAYLRFCITIVKDCANLHFNTRLVFAHLITQYMECFLLVLQAGCLKKKGTTLN
jgi:hypothetical protein